MNIVNPEIRELQQQVAELRAHQGQTDGRVEQMNRLSAEASRQTTWQFVTFTLTVVVTLLGAIYYQTDVMRRETDALRREFGVRIEAIEKHIEQSDRNSSARFEDMKERFDDLKQVVLDQRSKGTKPAASKKE